MTREAAAFAWRVFGCERLEMQACQWCLRKARDVAVALESIAENISQNAQRRPFTDRRATGIVPAVAIGFIARSRDERPVRSAFASSA